MKILAKDVIYGYDKELNVLNGISIEVSNNDIVAIVGASGSGKSTFLRLLCGIIKQEKNNYFSGSILIDGESPEKYARKGKIGFMFQEPALFPNLSVKANISIPFKFQGKKKTKRVDELLEKVGLRAFADYLPNQLSGGMKTRVALARTFVAEPSLLLLDEPFSSLDIKWKFLLYRELEDLRREYSCTVVLVTHDIQEALLLSNYIIVFGDNGKIVKEFHLEDPLPRVFKDDAIKDLQSEYLNIQKSIIGENL